MKHEEEPLDDYNKRMKEWITDMVREELEKYDGGFTDEWNDQRKKNAEVLGYKLSGKSDIKESKKKDSRGTVRDYKKEYAKYGSSKKAKKYRAELNQYNRKKGTYGNGDGKDASHKGGKIVGFESQSKNRGRAEKSRLKKEDIKEKSIPHANPNYNMERTMQKLAKSLGIKSVVSMYTGSGSLSYFLDDEREAKKLQKFLKRSFKRVRLIPLDKSKGDEANWVVAADMIGFESVNERVKDPKLKVGQKIRFKSDPRRLYKLKKINVGVGGISDKDDPSGTSYMFVAPGNRKEFFTKKTWHNAVKKGWLTLESINESEQDKIKQFLMKKGDNEQDATEKLKYYDMVSKMYKKANSIKKAEIMSSLWANENVAPNHDGKSAPYGSGYEEMDEGVSQSQAQEIMKQLGGRKFEMLMGVKSKGIGKDGLILHIGRNPKKISHIIIDLDRGRDLYNLTFGKIYKYQFKIVKKLKGIYVDQLHDMIEKYTGNLTTFRPRR
jgi:hypothetical protein